jgi:hypothetical protein
MTKKMKVIIGVVASIAFCLLCGVKLTGPGLYYDEVHQAPAAFAWVGKKPMGFSAAEIGNVTLLNMPYSGALKSNLYGLYLRFSGKPFSVLTWRCLGIAFVAVGIFLFCVICGPGLSNGGLLCFLTLLLSDVTVLLTSRHDWGPTALALSLRLLFLGVWLRSDPDLRRTGTNAFVLGVVVGVSIFEKLSSVVMLTPFYLILLTRSSLAVRTWIRAHLGVFAGAFPLLVVNISTWMHSHNLISLEPAPPYSRTPLGAFAMDYLSLGQGRGVRGWILGQYPSPLFSQVEASLIVAVCVLISWMALHNAQLRRAVLCVAMYTAVGLTLWALPAKVDLHHWILGTPFQYLGVALAVTSASEHSRLPKKLLLVVVCALVLLRVPSVVSTEHALLDAKTGIAYDPALTRLGEFVARRQKALFVAATWGIGVQMYCLSNGEPGCVAETFWDPSRVEELKDIMRRKEKRTIYLVVVTRYLNLFPELSANVIKAVEETEHWQEVPVDPELIGLAEIQVRKFEAKP